MGKSKRDDGECKDHRGKAKLHEVVRHGDDVPEKDEQHSR
jgi:hypothetical protein